MFASAAVCVVAVLMDHWLGEPRRWHPVVAFGALATCVERALNRPPGSVSRGFVAVLVLVAPMTAVAWMLADGLPDALRLALEALVLWLAMSLRGLAEHGRAVAVALERGDLTAARDAVGRIVSRNSGALDQTGVATAATESMLENGADAVFASLFWYLLAGLPGVILHRTVNTLDAMWGYRNDRFDRFGRFAARLDDVMNFIPARLTALTYTLAGQTATAWRCWQAQGRHWESPNAGPVMAAGAGALGVSLGGAAPYSEGVRQRPVLGEGPAATAGSIRASIGLVYRGVGLWLVAAVLLSAIH
ncbi:cobalamin biosynthesis protein [Marinobacter halodurans]|uniref:Cobalamin biosynthesis protein CobD n=1 Tax=Marinobacter halodurans TaxID=2528979 RepID=A0ABY1ZHY7_9GAMM|nr:adenosylcobinamide-phosphate synthase CbiB [Marinobacter halodurans]TBW50340.1 cobalamin biosynthesis protein [Marinobacter halodurans]